MDDRRDPPALSVEERLSALEERVETLEAERPGRKRLPIVVSEEHICGVEPAIDSATCPWASLYRRRQGCKGDACQRASDEYYAEYRKQK